MFRPGIGSAPTWMRASFPARYAQNCSHERTRSPARFARAGARFQKDAAWDDGERFAVREREVDHVVFRAAARARTRPLRSIVGSREHARAVAL